MSLLRRVAHLLSGATSGTTSGTTATPSPGPAGGASSRYAPEIDGEVHLRDAGHLSPGDIVTVRVEDSGEHDLFGVPA